jgi:hypothetical protein
MATDTSTPSGSLERDSTSDSHSDDFFSAEQQDSVFVQVAQADGATAPTGSPGAPQQVAIPAGTDVVRVAVQPGAVLELGAPFSGDAELIGRIGDGNLAIKVGAVTVILQGYVDANQQAPITVETADGQPIDVATMLASTDPAIDIQTAAGPGDAAGPQGADNNGALFSTVRSRQRPRRFHRSRRAGPDRIELRSDRQQHPQRLRRSGARHRGRLRHRGRPTLRRASRALLPRSGAGRRSRRL